MGTWKGFHAQGSLEGGLKEMRMDVELRTVGEEKNPLSGRCRATTGSDWLRGEGYSKGGWSVASRFLAGSGGGRASPKIRIPGP